MAEQDYEIESGTWGSLPAEPCRYCRRQGGVRFRLDDDPVTAQGPQVVRCEGCGRWWEADSSSA